ncbi:hypothetical protein KAR91_72720 [Candidatus Pacearchaeota archaeon]|nr:hypothetical protein [Candidatus Pacearchaeota archaeon]
MPKYKRGSQEEKDAQLLYSAKAFGGTIGQDLLELIERRDKKSTAMLELLEQCKALFYDLTEPKLDLSITGDELDEKYLRLGNDIKTLLKEAKVK